MRLDSLFGVEMVGLLHPLLIGGPISSNGQCGQSDRLRAEVSHLFEDRAVASVSSEEKGSAASGAEPGSPQALVAVEGGPCTPVLTRYAYTNTISHQ